MTKIKSLLNLLIAHLFGRVTLARFLGVKVGIKCRIYTHAFGSEPWLISIGDRVTISSGTKFLTHDGATWLVRGEEGRRFLYRPIAVGNDVFIGVDVIILPGVRLGDKVVVGAGSVLTKSIPNGMIVAGNPARVIGTFAEFESRIRETCPSEGDVGSGSLRVRVERARAELKLSSYREELQVLPGAR